MEFVCFADFKKMEDIGFIDKRDQTQPNLVHFSETGDKIAFLTRKYGVCDKSDCMKGDMLLNVLSVDSYSNPMQFKLYTTKYEACMDEGMSDDVIQKALAIQLTSERGLDVAFVAQYNDRIIFDCVTSTKQLPLRFPTPFSKQEEEEWRKFDPDY